MAHFGFEIAAGILENYEATLNASNLPSTIRNPQSIVVGVVGPCCAGKSTLVRGLCRAGYAARHIAQEHSFAPRMWLVIVRPDVLVYLDVSYPVAQQRRGMSWKPQDLDEQQRRLRHARSHCDLYVRTDPLTVQQVRERALSFLAGKW